MTHHIGFYIRISTDKGEGIETLANHKQIIKDFCKRKGFTYVTYEEVISGASEDRPQFEKLISEIHLYTAVGAISIDRIARNGLYAQRFKQACIRYHKPLITPTQMYNLNNPQESFLFDNMSAIAEFERQQIRNRIKMNRLSLSYQGKYAPTKAPYGYIRKNQKLELHPEYADIVKEIFRLSLEGYGDLIIANMLNDRGIQSPSKGKWVNATVRSLLRNEKYTGKLIYNDMEEYYDEEGKKKKRVIETVELENAFPSIVSSQDFKRVQEARKGRNRGKDSREVNKSHIRLLDSILFCGVCGRRLKINRNYANNKEHYIEKCVTTRANGFICSNTGIREDKVNVEIYKLLDKYKEECKVIAKQLLNSNIEGIQQENNKKIIRINKTIGEVKDQLNQLVVAFTMKLFTVEQIQQQQDELNARLRILEIERDELNSELTVDKQQSIIYRLENIVNSLDDFKELPLEEQNRKLRSLIKRVDYVRVFPEELLKMNANSKVRRDYPFKLEIEYL